MKLEVGMYVRTLFGIKKIHHIDAKKTVWKYLYKINDNNEYFALSDNDIIDADFDIINIIKEGDYINGERIDSVVPKDICGDEVLDNQHIFTRNDEIYEKNIKTIVSKEQFKNMEYRIGE